MKPYAIVFSGVPGSSKTIVANYFSVKFNLPVHSNDTVRSEVKEEFLTDNINDPDALAEYFKRSMQRCSSILANKKPIIFDSSVDRRWGEFKKQLEDAEYDHFLIDMNLSRKFLTNMFNKTGRSKFAQNQLDKYLKDHDNFKNTYSEDVNLEINDDDFINRLDISSKALENWLKNR